MDGDGEYQLREMDTMEWALDTLEKYHKKFKEFFLQATVSILYNYEESILSRLISLPITKHPHMINGLLTQELT